MKTVKDLFKGERSAWLENARAAAVKLAKEKPSITIEDVLKVCERPQYVHRNTTGLVFANNKNFKHVGWAPSTRPEMNGRYVRRWMLKKGL